MGRIYSYNATDAINLELFSGVPSNLIDYDYYYEDRVFLRGGYSTYKAYSGLFTLLLDVGDGYRNVGFRCAKS